MDKSWLEIIQKYTGIELDETSDYPSSHLGKMNAKDRSNDSDDSAIEVLTADTSVDRNQHIVTSTPKKCGKKTASPKNVPIIKENVKDMHTSTEKCKTYHEDHILMYYQNVRSIKSDNKMKAFKATSVSKYDVVIFTETWLKGGPLKHNMNVLNEHYDVYRFDRLRSGKSGGGGALIAVSAKFYNDRVLLEGYTHLEYVCVQFFNDNKSIFLYCAYISPDSAKSEEVYEDHFKAIQSIKISENDILIVVGDFNFPNTVWHPKDDGTFLLKFKDSITVTRSLSEKLATFIEFQSKCNLHQLCNYENPIGNVLDLVFSNDIDHISINKLPASQDPMSTPDEIHAPPFEIIFNSVSKNRKNTNI